MNELVLACILSFLRLSDRIRLARVSHQFHYVVFRYLESLNLDEIVVLGVKDMFKVATLIFHKATHLTQLNAIHTFIRSRFETREEFRDCVFDLQQSETTGQHLCRLMVTRPTLDISTIYQQCPLVTHLDFDCVFNRKISSSYEPGQLSIYQIQQSFLLLQSLKTHDAFLVDFDKLPEGSFQFLKEIQMSRWSSCNTTLFAAAVIAKLESINVTGTVDDLLLLIKRFGTSLKRIKFDRISGGKKIVNDLFLPGVLPLSLENIGMDLIIINAIDHRATVNLFKELPNLK